METKHAQAKVGFVVLVATAIVVFTILWGKNIKLTQTYKTQHILFPSVLGLEEGASVLVNGLIMGRVKEFSLRTDGVLTDILIEKDVELYTDAYAFIETPGLMDEKVVIIVPGSSGELIGEGALINGKSPPTFTQLLAFAGDMAEDLRSTMKQIENLSISLNSLLNDSNTSVNLASSLENLNRTTKSIDDLITRSRPKIDSTLTNITSLSLQAKNIMDRHGANIDTIVVNLVSLSEQLHTMTSSMGEFSDALQNGEGSLSKLLYDDALYNDFQRVTANLDSLIVDIRTKGIKTKLKIF